MIFLGSKFGGPQKLWEKSVEAISDIFESPESESEVTLVQKKSSQALENMRALVVHTLVQNSFVWPPLKVLGGINDIL